MFAVKEKSSQWTDAKEHITLSKQQFKKISSILLGTTGFVKARKSNGDTR